MTNELINKISNRIAIIGCGHVGATTAYALIQSGIAREIVLLDIDNERLTGEVMDLQHAASLAKPVRVWAGNYDDAAKAEIAIIAAGKNSEPGESRLDLLGRNVSVVRECVRCLREAGFKGVVLMTTNPVDILAQVAQKESGLSQAKVIGSGTVLDTARLRSALAEKLGIDTHSIHAYIIGEHGDSEVAVWISARIAGVPLREFASGSEELDYEKLLQGVRNAAPEIIARKGYTSFAIASSVEMICRAIIRDEKKVMPISIMTNGQHGITGVYLSLPCVVGREGVERVIELPLDEEELRGLRVSADVLLRKFQTLDGLFVVPPSSGSSIAVA
jgi:L-lactate dehydrogenase